MVRCPVVAEAPPPDPDALAAAAARLETYDWAVFASRRAVAAVAGARQGRWPSGLRTAAVGASTARALADAGAEPRPVVGPEAGALALWRRLEHADVWPGRRVLAPTTPGGRRELTECLVAAGAWVDVVVAYRTVPRTPELVAREWTTSSPDAVVLASPSAVSALAAAIGAEALRRLLAVVAIGPTTSAALSALGVAPLVSPGASFEETAHCLAGVWRSRSRLPEADGARPLPETCR